MEDKGVGMGMDDVASQSQGMSSPAIMKDNKGASAMAANEITGFVIFVILAGSQEPALFPLGEIF